MDHIIRCINSTHSFFRMENDNFRCKDFKNKVFTKGAFARCNRKGTAFNFTYTVFKNIFGDCFFEDDEGEGMLWKNDNEDHVHVNEQQLEELSNMSNPEIGRSSLLNANFGNNRSSNFFGF